MARQLNVRNVLRNGAILLVVAALLLGAGRLASVGSSTRILRRAAALAEEGQHEEAIRLYRSYLAEHAPNEDVLMGFARALEKAGRAASPMEIADTYRKVLEFNPKNYAALQRLTEITLAAARLRIRFSPNAPNEWADASRLAKRMIELDADKPEGHRCLGIALLGLGQFDEAKAAFEKLLAMQPKDDDAYFLLAEAAVRRGKPVDEWRRYIDQAVASNASVWSVHMRAYQFFAAHSEAESAKKALAMALDAAGNEPEVVLAAAIADEREGKLDSARERFQKLRELTPSSPTPYVALARLRRQGGDIEAALAILREGLPKADAGKADLLFHVADLLLEQRRLQEADQVLDQMRALTPNASPLALLEGHRALVGGNLNAARSQLERAALALELTVRAFPPLAQADLVVGRRYSAMMDAWFYLGKCYILLGNVYTSLGETGAARDTFREATNIWPTSVPLRTSLAQALLRTSEFGPALQQAEAATKLADDQGKKDADAWLTLARTLRAAARIRKDAPDLLTRALAAATKAIELRPRPDALIFLAQLQLDAEKPQLAESALARQLDDPKDDLQLRVARIALHAAGTAADPARARQEHSEAVKKHGEALELRLLQPLLLGPEATFEAREKCLQDLLPGASEPERPRVRAALANLYVSYFKPDKALEQLKTIARAEPQNAAIRRAILELAFEAGLDEPIASTIDELVQIEGPDSPDVVCARAEHDLVTARPEVASKVAVEVAERLEAYLKQSPTWRARAILGDIRKLQGKFPEAIDCYQTAFRANPSSIRAAIPLIRSLNQAERYEEAAVLLTRLADLPTAPPVLLDLQLDQFRRRDDLDGAIELMRSRLARHPQNASLLVTLADLELAKRNYAEAEKQLRKAHDSSPNDPTILDRLVLLLGRTKREQEALKLCNDFLAAHPGKPVGYLSRSRHYRLSGEPEKAAEDLQQALSLVPEKDVAARKGILINLGNVAFERGDASAALEWHHKAAALEPPGSDARKFLVERLLRSTSQEHIAEAERIVGGLLKETPGDPHAHLLKARLAALNPETFALAKQQCTQAMELAPRMPQPHVVLSNIYEAEGDLRRAIDEAGKAVASGQDSLDLLLSYARLLRRGKQYVEARAIVDRAARLFPGERQVPLAGAEIAYAERGGAAAVDMLQQMIAASPEKDSPDQGVRLILAWYLEKAGRDAEAEAQLKEACRASGNATGIVSALAQFLEQRKRYDETDQLLSQANTDAAKGKNTALLLLQADLLLQRRRGPDDLTAAERCARKALETQPQSSQAYRILGDVAADRKDPVAAEAAYRTALTHNRRNAAAANNLAWLLCGAGRADEALQWARLAVSLDSTNRSYHDTLGEAAFRTGEFLDAERAFRRCTDLTPNDPVTALKLGRTLIKLGRTAEAYRLLQQARDTDTQHPTLTPDHRAELARLLAQLSDIRKQP